MQNDKYYTPEIEEFHVGFQYEELWGLEGINGEWLDSIYEEDSSVRNLVEIVRVKKLDSEDIESLGWKFKDKCQWEIPFTYSFNEMGIGEVNDVNGGWNLIYTKDQWCSIVQDCYGKTSCFRGIIKNKSELRRLMKQLGINI